MSALLLALSPGSQSHGSTLSIKQQQPAFEWGDLLDDEYWFLGTWYGKELDPGERDSPIVWEPEHPVRYWADIRSYGQSAIVPDFGSTGCCFIGVSDVDYIDADWLLLGRSLDAVVNPFNINFRLGYPPGTLTASTLRQLVFQIAVESKSAGRERPVPYPNQNELWTFKIGPYRVYNEPVKDHPDIFARVVEQATYDYDLLRTDSLSRGDDQYLRWLANTAGELKIDYRDILGDNPDEGTVRPRTMFSDDFNRTSSTNLGNCDGSDAWTEVDGGWSINSDTVIAMDETSAADFPSSLRCEAALSCDDMTVEMTFTSPSSTRYMGPAVRFSNSTESFYGGLIRSSGSLRSIARVVGAAFTTLASDTSGGGPPQVIKLTASGTADLELFDDGVSALTYDDAGASQLTDVYSGLTAHSSTSQEGDDWSVVDDCGGAARRRVIIID